MAGAEGASGAANWLDLKLHGITGVPPSWLNESGQGPMYSDHVFRYEVEISLESATPCVFKNGRLLQGIPVYTDYIAAAKLPPFPTSTAEESEDGVPTIPPADAVPPSGDAINIFPSGAVDASPDAASPTAPPAILWVLGPEVDAQEVKDDPKGAPKGGKKPAGTTVAPTEGVKAIPPTPGTNPLCMGRIALPLTALEQFEARMEKFLPLVLTFRRVLRPNCPADWEDTQEAKYQARIPVSLKPLTEPGSTTLTASVVLEPILEPPKEDDKGKKKAAARKARGPAALTEELDLNEPHPYATNKTTCHISLTFASAITRLPQSRPKPDLQPGDMIPQRLKPPRRPVEATKQYTRDLESLMHKIVRDFREHAKMAGGSAHSEEVRQSFASYLSNSGQSHAYKELLVPAVQGIVKEKFIRKSNPSKEELDHVCGELYTYLLDHFHLTMNNAFGPHATLPQSSPALYGDSASRWKRLAEEAEVMREFGLASKYHQERLVQCRPGTGESELPDAWCEYAEYCSRIRDVIKAEQAYREALALDLSHLPSLIGYGALLLARSRFKEAEVLLQGAVDIKMTPTSWGCVALYYDVLLASLPDTPEEETRRLTCKRESKYAITQAVHCWNDQDASPEAVYEMLAGHLLALHQEELVNVCLSQSKPGPSVEYLFAKLYFQTQQYEESAMILNELIEQNPSNTDARLLLGDVYAFWGGRDSEAEQQYDAALRVNEHCGTGPAYVRLGNMYMSQGKFKDALSAFLLGAHSWPCGLTWLGVGIAYYRLEDLTRAEQALNESNILNNLNAKTWGYLALVCLRQRREEEGDQAFNQAVKQGLMDPYLITEIGVEQMRLTRHKIAEACFRRALAIQDDNGTRMHLARVLLSQRRPSEARDEFLLVASRTTNELQRQRAEEQAALLTP